MVSKKLFKAYYQLTKPGIIYGNALSAIGGYLLASKWHIHIVVFLGMLLGTSLVIGSACVFNNYMDRSIDKKMARTKKRATVTGKISGKNALIYATVLGVIGFVLLASLVNTLVVIIGVVGYIDYIFAYGYYKRHSIHGTIVGSISGATPVVAGYCAVTNHFDLGAIILFFILVLWQMPHFYAISMYRREDYVAAGLPVMSVKKTATQTKRYILWYITAFAIAVIALTLCGYAGLTFAFVMLGLSIIWLVRGIRQFNTLDEKQWGKSMFLYSLIVITALSGMLAVGSILP